LPSETIRVLELRNCSGLELPLSSAIALARLASMRLCHSKVPLKVLQGVIQAALVLAVIHLESVILENPETRVCFAASAARRPPCCSTGSAG
jgi:hypothetical protein